MRHPQADNISCWTLEAPPPRTCLSLRLSLFQACSRRFSPRCKFRPSAPDYLSASVSLTVSLQHPHVRQTSWSEPSLCSNHIPATIQPFCPTESCHGSCSMPQPHREASAFQPSPYPLHMYQADIQMYLQARTHNCVHLSAHKPSFSMLYS